MGHFLERRKSGRPDFGRLLYSSLKLFLVFQEDSTTLEPVKAKKVKIEENPKIISTPEGKKSKQNAQLAASNGNTSLEGSNSEQATPNSKQATPNSKQATAISKSAKNGSPNQAKNGKKNKKKKTNAK